MKVKIKDYEYEILEVDGSNEYLDRRYGMTIHDNQTIYLWKDMLKDRKRQVLFHELTHVFLEANGFRQHKTFNHEQICEFVSYYAEDILNIVNQYFK